MGNINSINSIKKFNFEDMQSSIHNNDNIIINTLSDDNQNCLIEGTITPQHEVRILNEFLNNSKSNTNCYLW